MLQSLLPQFSASHAFFPCLDRIYYPSINIYNHRYITFIQKIPCCYHSNNHSMQSNKHTNLHAQFFKLCRAATCHYAAAHVAARPIARHRPAIIVIAFLRCIAIAMLPLNSRAMISCGDEVALSRLANMMFE